MDALYVGLFFARIKALWLLWIATKSTAFCAVVVYVLNRKERAASFFLAALMAAKNMDMSFFRFFKNPGNQFIIFSYFPFTARADFFESFGSSLVVLVSGITIRATENMHEKVSLIFNHT